MIVQNDLVAYMAIIKDATMEEFNSVVEFVALHLPHWAYKYSVMKSKFIIKTNPCHPMHKVLKAAVESFVPKEKYSVYYKTFTNYQWNTQDQPY